MALNKLYLVVSTNNERMPVSLWANDFTSCAALHHLGFMSAAKPISSRAKQCCMEEAGCAQTESPGRFIDSTKNMKIGLATNSQFDSTLSGRNNQRNCTECLPCVGFLRLLFIALRLTVAKSGRKKTYGRGLRRRPPAPVAPRLP